MMYHSLLQFAGSEGDWIRRAGVLLAVIGTAVAAPDGTAWLWRAAKALPQRGWSKVRAALAWPFPRLRKHATGSASITMEGTSTTSGDLSLTVAWSDATPLERRIDILRENLRIAREEIEEVRRGTTELRQALEQRLGTVEAAHTAHRAAHEATQQQAVRVDAHGVFLIGLSVVMTGIPDALARSSWFGWLFLASALTTATVIAWRAVTREPRTV